MLVAALQVSGLCTAGHRCEFNAKALLIIDVAEGCLCRLWGWIEVMFHVAMFLDFELPVVAACTAPYARLCMRN